MTTVAIGGAGPAGIFSARALRRRFGDSVQISIYGDPMNAQFHTFVDPMDPSMVFDVGTCYVHRGYDNSLMPIIRELGMTLDVENNSPFHGGTYHVDAPKNRVELFKYTSPSLEKSTDNTSGPILNVCGQVPVDGGSGCTCTINRLPLGSRRTRLRVVIIHMCRQILRMGRQWTSFYPFTSHLSVVSLVRLQLPTMWQECDDYT